MEQQEHPTQTYCRSRPTRRRSAKLDVLRCSERHPLRLARLPRPTRRPTRLPHVGGKRGWAGGRRSRRQASEEDWAFIAHATCGAVPPRWQVRGRRAAEEGSIGRGCHRRLGDAGHHHLPVPNPCRRLRTVAALVAWRAVAAASGRVALCPHRAIRAALRLAHASVSSLKAQAYTRELVAPAVRCATFVEAHTPIALRAVPRRVAPAAARARIARAVCSAPYATNGDRALRTCPARLTRTCAAAGLALAVHATAAVDARCPELPELPARRRSGGARGVRCLGCTLGEHASGVKVRFGSHRLTEKPQPRGRIAGGRRGSLRVPQPLRARRSRQSRARAGGRPQPQAFPAAA